MGVPVLHELLIEGKCLGSAFLGGLISSLAQSGLQSLLQSTSGNLARWLRDNYTAQGQPPNHHLLRALRHAEAIGAVAICEATLLEDLGVEPALWEALRLQNWASLKARVTDPQARLLLALRADLLTLAQRLENPKYDGLEKEGAILLQELESLAHSASELSSLDPAQLKNAIDHRATETYLGALRHGLRPPVPLNVLDWTKWWFTGEFRGQPAPVLPPQFETRFRRDWLPMTALAFRENLKSDQFKQARRAFFLDQFLKLAGVPQKLDDLLDQTAQLHHRHQKIFDQLQTLRSFLASLRDTTELEAQKTRTALDLHTKELKSDLASFREETQRGFAETQQRIGKAEDRLAGKLEHVGEHVIAELRTEIRSQNTLKPSPSSSGPPHNLPALGTAGFFGRDDALAQLDQLLSDPHRPPTAITSIHGMGGVGKSELALRYARTRLPHYPGGLCWAKLRAAELAPQILSFAQTQLGLIPPDTLRDATDRLAYCWSHWPGGGLVLLVLDDVVDWPALQPHLPSADRFRILITTRQEFSGVQPVPLDVLQPPFDFELLEKLVGPRCEAQRADAEQLCAWLGHLPLGLELVGRYLAPKPDLSLADMLSRLRKKGLDHDAVQPTPGPSTAERGVAAAFDLSWDQLTPPARELGCLLSLFALAPIPWPLPLACFPGRDPEALEQIRDAALIQSSLLQRKGSNLFQLHQLLREFFQQKISALPQAAELKSAFVTALLAEAQRIPQNPALDIVAASTPHIPHFKELARAFAQDLPESEFNRPFIALQRLHKVRSLFDQAEVLSRAAVAAAQHRFGPDHPEVATSLNNLATLLQDTNRLPDAEPLMRQALRIDQAAFGPDHPNVATDLNNLASLLQATNRLPDAEPLMRQALRIDQAAFGPDHPKVATDLNNLAQLLQATNRLPEAEPLMRRVLEIVCNFTRATRHPHPHLRAFVNNYADLLQKIGRTEPQIRATLHELAPDFFPAP